MKELADSGDYDNITFLHFSGNYQNETNMEKLSSEEYSFGYIASWGSKDLKELKSTLDIISKLSNLIFDWVSKQFVVS